MSSSRACVLAVTRGLSTCPGPWSRLFGSEAAGAFQAGEGQKARSTEPLSRNDPARKPQRSPIVDGVPVLSQFLDDPPRPHWQHQNDARECATRILEFQDVERAPSVDGDLPDRVAAGRARTDPGKRGGPYCEFLVANGQSAEWPPCYFAASMNFRAEGLPVRCHHQLPPPAQRSWPSSTPSCAIE